jgi:hypothetical protein
VPTPNAKEKRWGKAAGGRAFLSRDGRFEPHFETFMDMIAAECPAEQGFLVPRGREVILEICRAPLIATAWGKISIADEMAHQAVTKACREYGHARRHALPVARELANHELERVLPKGSVFSESAYDPTLPNARSIRSWASQNLWRRVYEKLEGRRYEGPLQFMDHETMEIVLYNSKKQGQSNLEAAEVRSAPRPDDELRKRLIAIQVRERHFVEQALQQVPNSGFFSSRRLANFPTYWAALGAIVDGDPRTRKLAKFERDGAPTREAAKADAPLAMISRQFPDLNWSNIAGLCRVGNGAQACRQITGYVLDLANGSPAFGMLALDIAERRAALAEVLYERAESEIARIIGRHRQRQRRGGLSEMDRLMGRFEERLAVMRRLFLFVEPERVGFCISDWKA